jgi:Caspase domain
LKGLFPTRFEFEVTANAQTDVKSLLLAGLDDFARKTSAAAPPDSSNRSAKDYLDTIVFYYSGHGAAERASSDGGRSQSFLATPAIVLPSADQLSLFRAQALKLDEVVQQLRDSLAEKLYIIDACRVDIGGKQEKETDVLLFQSLASLSDAAQERTPYHIFVATGEGAESFALSEDDFGPQYQAKDLYKSPGSTFEMPPTLRGNGVFTNILLESFYCTDEVRPAERNKITPPVMSGFLTDYFSLGKSLKDLKLALDKYHVSLPVPRSRLLVDSGFKTWYHLLDQSARKCFDDAPAAF